MAEGGRVGQPAAELHRDALVFDFHMDLPSKLLAADDRDVAQRRAPGQVDLPRLQEGGVDAVVTALYTPHRRGEHPVTRTLAMIEIMYGLVRVHPDTLVLATTPRQIREAKQSGRIALFLSIENGLALDGRIELLHAYYRLGVRAMGLVWNPRNELADGVGARAGRSGLTAFGREVVDEMVRLGMVVDVSHLNETGFWEVAARVDGPFIASHSNARRLCDHPRNLSDEQIREVARGGGVIGLNFYPRFLEASGQATVESLVRHLEHIVELVGWQHVGLGSDYDGIPTGPEGMPDASGFPRLTEALLDRGHDPAAIRNLLGENWLHLLERVQSR